MSVRVFKLACNCTCSEQGEYWETTFSAFLMFFSVLLGNNEMNVRPQTVSQSLTVWL